MGVVAFIYKINTYTAAQLSDDLLSDDWPVYLLLTSSLQGDEK